MAEEDPWGFDSEETNAEVSAPVSAAAATEAAAGDGAPGAGDARPEEEVPTEDDHYRKPITLYKHWVRPRFLQYGYMYDYRTNYYDDVINYLDKRNRGLKPDVPRAQTWAERVLRTHTRFDDVYNLLSSYSKTGTETYKAQKKEDSKLIQTLSSSIKCHNYHTRAYISRKYSSVL